MPSVFCAYGDAAKSHNDVQTSVSFNESSQTFESGCKEIFFSPKPIRPALRTNQPAIHWVPSFFPQGYSGRRVQLITHFNLVLRLRVYRALPRLPSYAFTVWTRKNFLLPSKCILNLTLLVYLLSLSRKQQSEQKKFT